MPNSYRNAIDSTSKGEPKDGRCVNEQQNFVSRHYNPMRTFSANATDGSDVTMNLSPPTSQSSSPSLTSNSSLRQRQFFSCSSRTSSATPSLATTKSSSSNSSLYETLQAEAASCCPLCGFQILKISSSSSNFDQRSECNVAAMTSEIDGAPFSKTNHVKKNAHDNASTSSWMRTFVINQQEHPLNGGNQTSSSSLGTTTTSKIVSATTDLQGDTKPSNLPVGTCWVCLQAATKAAKERQVEEDRKLAASLSSIILEEEQDRADGISIPHYNNNIDNDNDNDEGNAIYSSNGDHYRRIGSIGTSKSTSHYRDEGLVAQEWLEEGKALIPMVSTKATQTSQTEEGQQYQNHDLRNNAEYRRHPPKNQECNTNGSKNHVADNGFPFIYIGEYNSVGQRHGPHGEIIWDSGDRYVGTFKNGMRSGQGTFFFQDGSEYTGDWSENQMHGRGQQKFANGDTYVGQYHKSERSGGPKWKYKFANGDLYVGGWEANRFHGFGRYFYADGSVLEGNFLNGAKHGKFKRQLPTKDLDILRFEDDHLVGKGVRWNAKRTKTWLLEFRNSNPHATTRNLFSDALKSRKKHHGHGAHRMVLGISNFGRRFDTRQRHSQTSVGFPSSVGASDGISTGNDEGQDADNPSHPSPESFPTSALSSTLPLDNLVTVVPQEKFKSIVKKSTRIPISQAVSIGYDCENGAEATGTKPSACQVSSK